jgi:outer membrane usher protein FimD/PapC
VVVKFPVERVRGGTFRLVTADGQPVPAGAAVTYLGNSFPVTYDGAVYVTGYDHESMGTAQWANSRCSFRLGPPPQHYPLPDMGTLTCAAPDGAEPTP